MKSKVPALKAANRHPKRRLKKDKDLVDDVSLYSGIVNSGRSVEGSGEMTANSGNTAKEHKKQLERLEEKDPEFYQFLKEHDQELLEFNDEDTDDDAETCHDGIKSLSELTDDDTEANFYEKAYNVRKVKVDAVPTKIITSEMVDIWCKGIKKNEKLGSIRSLLRAFRTACHHGDDGENEFSIVSSSVFNKIMLFVLNEMDGVLRGLLHYPNYGGKKESVIELTTTSIWNKYGSLVRLYLGNALHVLNQMTDEQMIAFTLKRIKDSAVFLVAFPVLLRKYIKVVLHFWSTGGSALQVVSFLFLRDLCVRLGSDCLDTCLKGIYKAYVMVCKIKGKYASVSKLQHLHFLGNCVTELYGVDLPNAYQHAFICIRQLATVLRNALSEKPKGNKEDDKGGKKERRGRKKSEEANSKNKKEAYLKVYDWQFINCLELWTNIICNYSSDADFQHLAYPLTQIIFGVARLVPTARYLPIRMQCARMLNRIGSSSGTFIPVSMLLLDVLDMKELANPPTGGVGKAVDFLTRKLVGRPTLKTRAFQDACIFSIVDLLAEHLAQWSYSVAFFELSFVTLVRLRNFCKTTKIDLFRKEIKELICQVEANKDFINTKRSRLEFSLGDHLRTASFLQGEKESRSSPLSQFSDNLKLKARQRSDSLNKTSLLVGTKSSKYSDKLSESEEDNNSENEESDEGITVFSSSWLPNPMAGLAKSKCLKEQQRKEQQNDFLTDEDVVEDLVLSSDDDEPVSSSSLSEDEQDVPVKAKSGGNSKRKSFSLPEKTKRLHTEVENTKHKHSSGSKTTLRPAVKKFKKA